MPAPPRPVLLVHGYSAESPRDDPAAIAAIYGTLPAALRRQLGGRPVADLNVVRYLSLDDAVRLDDLARAMQRALEAEFPALLKTGFDAVVHSTGALVVRNWLRRHSPRPSPLGRVVYLAGALFGSGWAHVGRGQLAKWGRLVFQGGTERGVQLLDALELGAAEALDLHGHFLAAEHSLSERYRVHEACLVGSQVLETWLPIPVRYAHEDGSDGVVRVAAANAGWNHVRIEPKRRAHTLGWEAIETSCTVLGAAPCERHAEPERHYRVAAARIAGEAGCPAVPLAVLYECAHGGDERGIVAGAGVRAALLPLVGTALGAVTPSARDAAARAFAAATRASYARAAAELAPRRLQGLFNEPRAQYDPHAQLVFRLRDQDGRPVEHFDVFVHAPDDPSLSATSLFEHAHRNRRTPGIVVFYLRCAAFDPATGEWVDRLGAVGGVRLEIVATEPGSGEIRYLPLSLALSRERLGRFVQPHRTTVFDVTLLRLPAPAVFRVRRAP